MRNTAVYTCIRLFTCRIPCSTNGNLRFASTTSTQTSPSTKHYKVLILGGGTGGCAVASRLTGTFSKDELAVVDRSDHHYYQPLWTLVGAGIRTFEESVRPMEKTIPAEATFIKDSIAKLVPTANCVELASGQKLSYDYLVISLGMTLRFDLVKGAQQALDQDARVSSNYHPCYIHKTLKNYESFKGGKAVFTLPAGPIKCAGAPQKVMYLFEHYLCKKKQRDTAELHYFTSLGQMFSVTKYADSLAELCRQRNIHTYLRHHLIEVDMSKSEAVFEHLDTKAQQRINYDFLHITPPMTVPDVLHATPDLTDPEACNYVSVDKDTLQHKKFPNIFALGDCCTLPTSKTAAAISSQSSVLQQNLTDLYNGGKGKVAKYDGYTACPLVTGYNRGILAEFDYSSTPLETFPINQAKEHYFLYFVKANIMPALYWDWLIKGVWSGPKRLRQLFHLRRKSDAKS